MTQHEAFVEDIKNKMEHDAPYIWIHLTAQKEKGFDYVVYPDQDTVRQNDFEFFITKDDARDYFREQNIADAPLAMHAVAKITDALLPLVENELNDFFDRHLGRDRGRDTDHEMDM